MDSQKLEAFVDAVLAIILTVIVLELPQPETITFAGFWALKTSFFAYITSFIVVLTNWYFFHIIFEIIKKINGKVITMTGLVVFVMSLLPYFTLLISNNFSNLNAQLCYCGFFIVIELAYDVLFWMITNIEHNKQLSKILNLKRTAIHLIFYAFGIILGYFVMPEIIVAFVFIAVLTWFVHVYMSIKDIDINSENID
ncbi:TMEM175 family protein [Methanobrevibacter sp.]|uniref:TMEM175 family protein n=1 Tax=Methanobrevibacter sp. TaxID=66852 RepID=UPI0025DDFBAB|nr:TMEM175 family protein [Methanobrevibacter sp.]MBQ6511262.1 DUF1211 domain-containing protein [Methanobrevibacter sp.]